MREVRHKQAIRSERQNGRQEVSEARKGLAPKPTTSAQRVEKLRAARDALGLRRLELYAHPEDWPPIKALAEKLQRKRARTTRMI